MELEGLAKPPCMEGKVTVAWHGVPEPKRGEVGILGRTPERRGLNRSWVRRMFRKEGGRQSLTGVRKVSRLRREQPSKGVRTAQGVNFHTRGWSSTLTEGGGHLLRG